MNGYHPDGKPPTWLDRLYVFLICALLLTACGIVTAECVSMVARWWG